MTYERKVRKAPEQAQKWVELVSDMQLRSEVIKAKIKDLAPDLFMKSVCVFFKFDNR